MNRTVLVGLLTLLTTAPAVFCQGFFTNATGVSITSVMRSGYDVTFDVTMTTTGPTYTSAFNPGRLGPTSFVNTSTNYGTFFVAFSSFNPYVFSYGRYNGAMNTSSLRYDVLNVLPATDFFTASWHYQFHATTHVLPGVDFGDGSTIPTASLSLSSSTVLPTGNMQRVFRGSFSHTYGDAGNYTIRVATPCCPNTFSGLPVTSPTYGTPLTFNAYPVRFTVGYYQDWYFNAFSFSANRAYYAFNPPQGTTSTFGTSSFTVRGSPATLRTGFSSHDFTLNTPGYVGALVATAAADLSVLEVPTASGYALLALALLLAGVGIFLLRR